MKSEATIRTELRRIMKLWQKYTHDDRTYEFLRGAEFALAWVMEPKRGASGCKVTTFVEKTAPECERSLLAALKRAQADEAIGREHD